jgi:hypothetical protein
VDLGRPSTASLTSRIASEWQSLAPDQGELVQRVLFERNRGEVRPPARLGN